MPTIASEVLTKGIEQGIITAEQAERLRAIASEPLESPASPDDERLRFISGFGDIFVAIGLTMFLGAIGYFAFLASGHLGACIAVAVAAWLLAEFFTRRRRMALPSIILLVVFATAVFIGGTSYFFGSAHVAARPPSLWGLFGLNVEKPTAMAAAAFLTLLVTAAHYWRFQVPITVAAGCAALAVTVIGLAHGLLPGLSPTADHALVLGCGIAIFGLAMRFDIADPERLTRSTDVAFWLHLLAAPMIVQSLIGEMMMFGSTLSPASAVAIMLVFLALGVVAVLIDRRAMLVSGLSYAGFAFWTLISQAGLSDMTTPITIFALGAFVLLLSAGWRPLRSTILSMVPLILARRLPKTSAPA